MSTDTCRHVSAGRCERRHVSAVGLTEPSVHQCPMNQHCHRCQPSSQPRRQPGCRSACQAECQRSGKAQNTTAESPPEWTRPTRHSWMGEFQLVNQKVKVQNNDRLTAFDPGPPG